MSVQAIVKTAAVAAVIAISAFSASSSTYAFYTWNRNVTNCSGGVCTNHQYHQVCRYGYCYTHRSTNTWVR